MAGNINANLAELEGTPLAEAIADEITVAGLMDISLHFFPHQKTWLKDRSTWRIQRDGREAQSQTDYIIGTDHKIFQDVAVHDTRHHSDHYMVLEFLRGEPAKELTRYLRKACHFPLPEPPSQPCVGARKDIFIAQDPDPQSPTA